MKQNLLIGAFGSICCLFATTSTLALERIVSTTAEFSAALAAANPGDEIVLQPGVYGGGHFRSRLQDVVIRSADPLNRAIFDGSNTAIQLSDAQQVTIADLVFRNQASNSLNIDDGGSFDSPSSDITLRNLLVQDIQNSGNLDGIKLSGVNHFVIERVEVRNWGSGGSAVDMVGCHYGLIQNSLFVHTAANSQGNTIQPKGGTKDITIRANRIELPRTAGRAIQAGGSTGTQFFRFIEGDSGYEADEIIAEGNVVIGGTSAFSWVNIDGGIFHHNLVHRPGNWTMRILNENQGNPIIDTQNGQFHDNVVIFNDTPSEYNTTVNVGPETFPNTFSFARNKWFNIANPTANGSTPILPTPEVDGVYGVDPGISADEPIVWEFYWGRWVVNATTNTAQVEISNAGAFRKASPSESAVFRPLESNPLSGAWEFQAMEDATLQLPAFSQIILIDPIACPDCMPLSGDYNGDGQISEADYARWRNTFGSMSQLIADGNLNGIVDAADYVFWRDRLTAGSGASFSVSEPSSVILFIILTTRIVPMYRERHEPNGSTQSNR